MILLLPKGDKVTKYFLPDGVSSEANMTYVVNSTNRLGAKIINLDATVNKIVDNVKAQAFIMTASITSFQEFHSEVNQRLDTWKPLRISYMKISL